MLANSLTERGERIVRNGDADVWAKGISEVVVLCSASRGGSSALFRTLAASRNVLTLRGEESPQLRSTIQAIEMSSDDAVDLIQITEDEISRCRKAMRADIGVGLPQVTTTDIQSYVAELASRLPLQWPRLTRDEVDSMIRHLLSEQAASFCSEGGLWDIGRLFRETLNRFTALGLVDPGYYDRDPLLDMEPQAATPTGPPSHGEPVEEPPFIPILARDRSGADPGRILLKAPSSNYRLSLISRLFPNAQIKILHLTRNPAASVNGLIDGWNHWGFFSRDVSKLGMTLEIEGYSDRHVWGDRWWNFDLPPGWQKYTQRPLAIVCAFQWEANHRAVLDFVRANRVPYLRVRFEDLLAGTNLRADAMERICDFVGSDDIAPDSELPGAVMSTTPPELGRWRRREERIISALKENGSMQFSAEIGYPLEGAATWV